MSIAVIMTPASRHAIPEKKDQRAALFNQVAVCINKIALLNNICVYTKLNNSIRSKIKYIKNIFNDDIYGSTIIKVVIMIL